MLWIEARTVSVFAACLVGVLWVGGCRGASPRDGRLGALPSAVRQAPSVPSSPIPDEPLRIPVGVDETDRWLWVEKERASTAGGWATGSFDPKRNKLSIETHDVAQFAIDVGRIPIDWERPVIFGIDGRNSELRRRDYTLLHIARDSYGRWVVLEP